MPTTHRLCQHSVRTTSLILAGLLMLAGSPSLAQEPGPVGPRPKPKPPVKPQPPGKPGDEGAARCLILKFEPAGADKDGSIAGHLKVRPLAKKAKTLKLIVPKSGDFQFTIGSHTVGEDLYAGLPWKGLLCDVRWSVGKAGDRDGQGAKPHDKKLQSLTFETIQVTGKIVQIEDDTAVLKAKPVGNRPWPETQIASPPPKTKPTTTTAPKPATDRKLTLKVLDGITECADEKGKTATLRDFAVDQEVQATLVFGTDTGILVSLKPATAQTDEKEPLPDGGRTGVTPRGPKNGDKDKPPRI